jgi:hypothetical protein
MFMDVFLVLGAAVVLYGLHRTLLAAELRGWIFYRHRPPRVRFLGLLEELVEPRVEYLIEEESSEAIRADHAHSGEGTDLHGPNYRDIDGSSEPRR